jgi:hypothetical protein
MGDERHPQRGGSAARGGGDLLSISVAWGDRWYDPAEGLLWNPAGSFAPVVRDATVHLLPQSAWYAFGLLERGRAGDVERAATVLSAVLSHQYDRPGTPWHGTFARVAEAPQPGAGALEWVDYDPNWRQFIGTTFLAVLRHHERSLDPVLVARMDAALSLAVRGEPAGRVGADYTNIAVLKAALEVEVGARLNDPPLVAAGEQLAAEVVERFERSGGPDEYNSPTYYGVDLVGLALWRTTAASERLARWGAQLEAALWRDLALFFHAGLGNLAGPFDRAYGLDMGRYLAAVGLWWWPRFGLDAAPLPDVGADAIPHGHDLLMGPLVARLAGPVPADAVEFLVGFEGVRQIERVLSGPPERVATAWLEEDLALGGMASDGVPAAGQRAPATVHWRLPADAGVGTVRFSCDDPTSARAVDGSLTITTSPGVAQGASDTPADAGFFVDAPPGPDGAPLLEPSMIGPGRWDLPGLPLRVHSTGALVGVEPFGTGLVVTFRAPAGGHRLVLRRVGGP